MIEKNSSTEIPQSALEFLNYETPIARKNQHSYYKELKRVLETSDVIIEVLDARDPLGCRCRDIELRVLGELSKSLNKSKKIILILNKIDLVPAEVVSQWLNYFRREFPTLAFKASTQAQRKLSHATASIASLHTTSQCVGAEAILQLLKNYCRSMDMKTSITVGIVGYPNVGKSSFINSLKRARSVAVAPTPGFTKTLQRVRLDKNIILVDSPGVIFGEQDNDTLLLRNCVKLEHVDDHIAAVSKLLSRCGFEELCRFFQISKFDDVEQFLYHIAEKRGKLLKGGVHDLVAAARLVLQEWVSGELPYYTLPPQVFEEHASSEIVQEWGKEFDIKQYLRQSDQETLPALSSVFSKKFLPIQASEMLVDPAFNDDSMEVGDNEEEDFDDQEMDDMQECETAMDEEETLAKPVFVLNDALIAKKMKRQIAKTAKDGTIAPDQDDLVNTYALNKQKALKKAKKEQQRAINRELKKVG